VLKRFYGRDNIHFSFMSDEFNGVTRGADGHVRPVVVRSFRSFSQAKMENAQSRIYLGIHWAFDRDEGIKQGVAVGNYVFEHMLTTNSHERHPNGESLGEAASTFDGLQSAAIDAVMSDLSASGSGGRKRGR
jgi:hypothetical protein